MSPADNVHHMTRSSEDSAFDTAFPLIRTIWLPLLYKILHRFCQHFVCLMGSCVGPPESSCRIRETSTVPARQALLRTGRKLYRAYIAQMIWISNTSPVRKSREEGRRLPRVLKPRRLSERVWQTPNKAVIRQGDVGGLVHCCHNLNVDRALKKPSHISLFYRSLRVLAKACTHGTVTLEVVNIAAVKR